MTVSLSRAFGGTLSIARSPAQSSRALAEVAQAVLGNHDRAVDDDGFLVMREIGVGIIGSPLGHAAAGSQQVGVVVHAPVQPGIGGLGVPHGGQFVVGCGGVAEFVATAQHVHRQRATVVGGGFVPQQRGGFVACGALAFHVHLRQQQLRSHLSGLCGIADDGEGGSRVGLQLRGERVGIQ